MSVWHAFQVTHSCQTKGPVVNGSPEVVWRTLTGRNAWASGGGECVFRCEPQSRHFAGKRNQNLGYSKVYGNKSCWVCQLGGCRFPKILHFLSWTQVWNKYCSLALPYTPFWAYIRPLTIKHYGRIQKDEISTNVTMTNHSFSSSWLEEVGKGVQFVNFHFLPYAYSSDINNVIGIAFSSKFLYTIFLQLQVLYLIYPIV